MGLRSGDWHPCHQHAPTTELFGFLFIFISPGLLLVSCVYACGILVTHGTKEWDLVWTTVLKSYLKLKSSLITVELKPWSAWWSYVIIVLPFCKKKWRWTRYKSLYSEVRMELIRCRPSPSALFCTPVFLFAHHHLHIYHSSVNLIHFNYCMW